MIVGKTRSQPLIWACDYSYSYHTQSSSGPSCPSRKAAIRWHRCSSEPSVAYVRTHCVRKSSGTVGLRSGPAISLRRHLGVPGAYRRSQSGVLGGKPERRGSWAAAVRGPSGYSDALKPRALSVTCASGSAPLAVGDRLCRCRYSASNHAMALRHQGLHGRDSITVASSPFIAHCYSTEGCCV